MRFIVCPDGRFQACQKCLDAGIYVSPNTWLCVSFWQWFTSSHWIAAVLACVFAIHFYLNGATFRQRLSYAAAGVIFSFLIVYVLCLACFLLISSLNRDAILADERWHSLWMPRYLGIIWPAFAIAVAVLLARLPTRPLRFAAVGFLVLVNLAQFSARVHQSEPPTDILAADMLKSGRGREPIFSAASPKDLAPSPAKEAFKARRGIIT